MKLAHLGIAAAGIIVVGCGTMKFSGSKETSNTFAEIRSCMEKEGNPVKCSSYTKKPITARVREVRYGDKEAYAILEFSLELREYLFHCIPKNKKDLETLSKKDVIEFTGDLSEFADLRSSERATVRNCAFKKVSK